VVEGSWNEWYELPKSVVGDIPFEFVGEITGTCAMAETRNIESSAAAR